MKLEVRFNRMLFRMYVYGFVWNRESMNCFNLVFTLYFRDNLSHWWLLYFYFSTFHDGSKTGFEQVHWCIVLDFFHNFLRQIPPLLAPSQRVTVVPGAKSYWGFGSLRHSRYECRVGHACRVGPRVKKTHLKLNFCVFETSLRIFEHTPIRNVHGK